MKIDLFTKGILTVIAVALGFIAFDTQPVKQAKAYGGGYEVLSRGDVRGFWVKDGYRVKLCRYEPDASGKCFQWQSIK